MDCTAGLSHCLRVVRSAIVDMIPENNVCCNLRFPNWQGFPHRLYWNVKAGGVVRIGYCATVETEHQKAGRGLTSYGPLHINWKGMKCQACFHHSETVKTLPPPPPPPTNWSPPKPSPHITHTPPTPNNLPQP